MSTTNTQPVDHPGTPEGGTTDTAGAGPEWMPGLEAVVDEVMAECRVPGAAVGVYHAGAEHYVYRGVTSVENSLPVDAGTYVQIGSVSKTYTVLAVMCLADDGLVRLDAPVLEYVPELRLKDPDVQRQVTVRHLLNHTAGWRGDFFHDAGEGDDALARYVARMVELDQVHPLGSIASYNNAAVNLAGRVVEKVTGRSFEDAVHALVFDRIGLRESTYLAADVMTRRFVVGHQEHGGQLGVARQWAQSRSSNPCGGIVSTARDQLRYARYHLAGLAGEEPDGWRPAFADMFTPTVPFGDEQVGLGWMLEDIDGTTLASHGGTTVGQECLLVLAPGRDFAVGVFFNTDYAETGLQQITDWAAKALLGVERAEPEPVELPLAELRRFTGQFDGGIYILTLGIQDGQLCITGFELTTAGEAEIKEAGIELPELRGSILDVLPRDRFRFRDGPYAGTVGSVHRGDDSITAINLGRVLPRVGPPTI